MDFFKPGIVVIDLWRPDPTTTWGHVAAGDMIVYEEGASYYVEAILVEEPTQVTFGLRTVVSPREGDMKFWDRCYLSVKKQNSFPSNMILTKG